jgi:hypothetical protein
MKLNAKACAAAMAAQITTTNTPAPPMCQPNRLFRRSLKNCQLANPDGFHSIG